jgi:hypothetical protein
MLERVAAGLVPYIPAIEIHDREVVYPRTISEKEGSKVRHTLKTGGKPRILSTRHWCPRLETESRPRVSA